MDELVSIVMILSMDVTWVPPQKKEGCLHSVILSAAVVESYPPSYHE